MHIKIQHWNNGFILLLPFSSSELPKSSSFGFGGVAIRRVFGGTTVPAPRITPGPITHPLPSTTPSFSVTSSAIKATEMMHLSCYNRTSWINIFLLQFYFFTTSMSCYYLDDNVIPNVGIANSGVVANGTAVANNRLLNQTPFADRGSFSNSNSVL